ncbi:hypothetical protein D8W73_03740 [Citrobacter amalonaticus]|nr:hypothetical protein [Citrobacter amalonaticus]
MLAVPGTTSLACVISLTQAYFFCGLNRGTDALAALTHPGHIVFYAPRDSFICRLSVSRFSLQK